MAGLPVIGRRRGAFSTLLPQSGLRASTGGVLATKRERKMLASTCLYSFYAWLILFTMTGNLFVTFHVVYLDILLFTSLLPAFLMWGGLLQCSLVWCSSIHIWRLQVILNAAAFVISDQWLSVTVCTGTAYWCLFTLQPCGLSASLRHAYQRLLVAKKTLSVALHTQ